MKNLQNAFDKALLDLPLSEDTLSRIVTAVVKIGLSEKFISAKVDEYANKEVKSVQTHFSEASQNKKLENFSTKATIMVHVGQL